MIKMHQGNAYTGNNSPKPKVAPLATNSYAFNIKKTKDKAKPWASSKSNPSYLAI